MKSWPAILACLIVLWCPAVQAVEGQSLRIIVYGDSLMSGYQLQPDEAFPAKLDRKLKEIGYTNVEVLNMSTPGETTTGALDRVSSVLVKRPDIVFIEFGANDTLRGISVNLIYQNLANIIRRFVQDKVYVILVGVKPPAGMGPAYTGQLEAAYAKLATAYKTAYYPNALEGVIGQAELTQADGLHPNAKGVDVMVENMFRLADEALRWKWSMIQYEQYYKQYETDQQKYEQPQFGEAPDPAPEDPKKKKK